MIYVMSDLHGCYEEYLKMLDHINFNNNDTLYILGDVCDRGDNPIKILKHMMNHENIIPIFGNHDVDALLNLVKVYNKQDVDLDRDFRFWYIGGGKSTYDDFVTLNKIEQKEILLYMQDFLYYKELKVNDITYILVHAGLENFKENKPIDSYKLDELIYDRTDYDKTYFKDKILITGHTPTIHIDRNMKGKIIHKNNHIAIDCGCVFGYGLGCICLDTMQEFYI